MKDEEKKRILRKELGPAPVLRTPSKEQEQREKTFDIMVRRGPPSSEMTQEEWEEECCRRILGEE